MIFRVPFNPNTSVIPKERLLSVDKVDKKLQALTPLLTIQIFPDDLLNCNIVQLHGYIKSENYKPRASCRRKKNQFGCYLVSYGMV